MALVGALCINLHAVAGFTNGSLRALVAGLLGGPYSTAQMTYDLRAAPTQGSYPAPGAPEALRRHSRRHQRGALLHQAPNRLLRPLLAGDLPPAPLELRRALRVVERSVDHYIAGSRIAA